MLTDTIFSRSYVAFSMNLRRAKRFKPHNITLVGMIPRPRQPANLKPFLEPLVSDLNRLYQMIFVNSPTGRIKIRAILSCITCDLPATRKVCGFYNFNALKGCSKVSQLQVLAQNQIIQVMTVRVFGKFVWVQVFGSF